jgi:hypothetical protein
MKTKSIPRFIRDFREVVDRFPKLKYSFDDERKLWTIAGELDICDVKGIYWGTFEILIIVPQIYPYCVPVVQEVSNIIPRDIDWHIDESGFCCLDIEHRLIQMSRRGLRITDFITNKIYPYFANQLYKLESGSYAGSEYALGFLGVVQFYQEDLKLDPVQATAFLERLVSRIPVGRNEKCLCSSGLKLKCCHIESFRYLKDLRLDKLKEDLVNFQNMERKGYACF